jgi:hypothetical protein
MVTRSGFALKTLKYNIVLRNKQVTRVLKDYVILAMFLRQNEISLPYLPYECTSIFTLLHCVNSSFATMFDLMMA